MNKGFTLIELLAVIIVLSIILVIIMPGVINIVNDSKTDIYHVKEKSLGQATSDYVLYKNIILPNINDQIIINIDDLIEDNFATKIYDLDNTEYECLGYVIVKKINNHNNSYDACIFCENYETGESYCDISQVQ